MLGLTEKIDASTSGAMAISKQVVATNAFMPRDQTRKAREGETRRQDGRSRPKSSSPGRGEGSQDIDLITPTHDSSKGITT